jgi:hypothetical protein
MNNEWLVLGGSLSAPETFKVAREQYPDATLITTNSGIRLCEPDYYLLSDKIAVVKFYAKAAKYQAKGMKIIAPSGEAYIVEWKKLTVDHVIHVPGMWDKIPWVRGAYSNYTLSGLYCIMFAINHGATKIILPGHEGFNVDAELYHWDQSDHSTLTVFLTEKWKTIKHDVQITIWEEFVEQCPDIEFVFYGDLNYPVEGENVTKISCNDTMVIA